MTEQILTITGLKFTADGRTVAHGAVIREGETAVEEILRTGGAQMGTLHRLPGCPTGRVDALFAGRKSTVAIFGERFLLAAGEEPRQDWLGTLRRLVAAR